MSTIEPLLTSAEYARRWLRGEILEARIPPGTRLRQATLAKQLHMSTTPVREALRDLAREGLVSLTPHQGAIVQLMTVDKVREIYEIRVLLEPALAMRTMPMLGEEVLVHASALYDQMEVEDDPSAWSELNRTFHDLLFAPGAESEIGVLVEQLRERSTPWVAVSLSDADRRLSSNAEHAKMLQAIRSKDASAYAGLVEQHLRGTVETLEVNSSERVKATHTL